MTTTTQPATRSESRAIAALTRALQDAGIEVVGQHRADLRKFFVAALRDDDLTLHFHRHDQAAINRTYRSGAICAYFAEHTSGEAFIAWKNRRDVFFDCAGRMQLELDQVGPVSCRTPRKRAYTSAEQAAKARRSLGNRAGVYRCGDHWHITGREGGRR